MPQYVYMSGNRVSEIQIFRKDSIALSFARQVAQVSNKPIMLYSWKPDECALDLLAKFDHKGERQPLE